MDKLVYRGLQYNSENPKREYVSWYKKIHNDASFWLTYRGLRYRPCNNHKIASK